MKFLLEKYDPNKEQLFYDDLVITEFGKEIDDDWYQLPYYPQEREITIDYEYEVDKEDVKQVIIDIVQHKENKDWNTDEELEQWLEDNYDEYLEKYEKEILKYFREDAIEKAQNEYESEYYSD